MLKLKSHVMVAALALVAGAVYATRDAHADVYVAAGYGATLRDKSVDLTAGWLHSSGLGVEIGYENMGRQPAGYNNVNKFLTLNVVGFTKFSDRLYGYGKAGIHSSKLSHNGTNNYDRSGDSLIGYQAAVGLETPLYKGVTLYGQWSVYEYRQVNNPNMGGFHKPSVGVRIKF